jgi:prevent-host-death family protein
MKTATVRDLRNRYTALIEWIKAGEEVLITQKGKSIARLVPEKSSETGTVDWSKSAAVRCDRSGDRVLSGEESAALIAEAGGRW